MIRNPGKDTISNLINSELKKPVKNSEKKILGKALEFTNQSSIQTCLTNWTKI